MALELTRERRQDAQVLVLAGALGNEDAPAIRAAALELVRGDQDVRVDLSGAGHAPGAVVQVLCALRRTLESQGRSLRLHASEPVRPWLRLAALEDLID